MCSVVRNKPLPCKHRLLQLRQAAGMGFLTLYRKCTSTTPPPAHVYLALGVFHSWMRGLQPVIRLPRTQHPVTACLLSHCDTCDPIGQAECDALSRKHAEALGRKAALAADVAGVEGDVEALGRRKAETLARKAALSSDLAGAEGDLEQHIASLQVRGRVSTCCHAFSPESEFSQLLCFDCDQRFARS
jgi:hypothetical protein